MQWGPGDATASPLPFCLLYPRQSFPLMTGSRQLRAERNALWSRLCCLSRALFYPDCSVAAVPLGPQVVNPPLGVCGRARASPAWEGSRGGGLVPSSNQAGARMSPASPGWLDYSGRTPSFSQLFLLHKRWWHWEF